MELHHQDSEYVNWSFPSLTAVEDAHRDVWQADTGGKNGHQVSMYVVNYIKIDICSNSDVCKQDRMEVQNSKILDDIATPVQ